MFEKSDKFDALENDIRRVHEKFHKDHDRLRRELLASLDGVAPPQPQAGRSPWLRMIKDPTMISRLIKISAAAAVIAAVCAAAWFAADKSAAPAYALSQTVEANRSITFSHIRISPSGQGVGEAWAEFDGNGQLLRLRMDFPDTQDGPKVVLWEQGKARVWFKAKNSFVIADEPNMVRHLKGLFETSDPRVMVGIIERGAAAGKLKIEQESTPADQPIKLIIRDVGSDDRMSVCYVDRQSKLATRLEKYRLQDGAYVLQSAQGYVDYNQPDEAAFTPEIPQDVVVIDQTRTDIGLARGEMTDAAAAEEVVRQFLQAMVDEDYDKAGNLLEGVPGSFIRAQFGGKKFLRVLSVGPGRDIDDNYGPGATEVPCQFEVAGPDGQPVLKEAAPWVRGVYNRPERRTIFGHLAGL